jgi:hypothetical protein
MKNEPESEKKTVLEAMARARFTILLVTAQQPGIGVHTVDLTQNRPCFVVDLGMSETASTGPILLTRLIEFPQFRMTSGAGLIVDSTLARSALRSTAEALGMPLPDFLATARPKEKSRFATLLLSQCFNQAEAPGSAPELSGPT